MHSERSADKYIIIPQVSQVPEWRNCLPGLNKVAKLQVSNFRILSIARFSDT